MTLDDVKAGDEVYRISRDDYLKLTVEKASKLHITVNGVKYRRKGGREVHGDRWHFSWIEPVTPKTTERDEIIIAEQVLKRRLRAASGCLRDMEVTRDNIDAVEAFLKTMQK